MVLERLRLFGRPRQVSDQEIASRMVERITDAFWKLENRHRAFMDGPSWEEISDDDLLILPEEERAYLLENGGGTTRLWIYAHTRENQAFMAIGFDGRRVKFFVNGDRPRLTYETRVSVGVWQEGGGREITWEELERIVFFVEQVPQRRLLTGSGSPQIDGLPGTEV